jgi:hypothetical protein
MKDIDKMNLAELAEIMAPYSDLKERIINRLRVIHEETRWIPVLERMPTEEDADRHGYVLWWSEDEVALPVAHYWDFTGVPKYHFTHWKPITAPEGE